MESDSVWKDGQKSCPAYGENFDHLCKHSSGRMKNGFRLQKRIPFLNTGSVLERRTEILSRFWRKNLACLCEHSSGRMRNGLRLAKRIPFDKTDSVLKYGRNFAYLCEHSSGQIKKRTPFEKTDSVWKNGFRVEKRTELCLLVRALLRADEAPPQNVLSCPHFLHDHDLDAGSRS